MSGDAQPTVVLSGLAVACNFTAVWMTDDRLKALLWLLTGLFLCLAARAFLRLVKGRAE